MGCFFDYACVYTSGGFAGTLEPMLAEHNRTYTNDGPKFPVIRADAAVKRDEKWG